MELEGVLTEEPMLTYSPTGKSICTLRLGDGQKITLWEELAEKVHQAVHQGDKIKAFGKEDTRWWTTSEGDKRSAKEFTAYRLQVLERPPAIKYCCYWCEDFSASCMTTCYNAFGGPGLIKSVCEVVDGECKEGNRNCWKEK